MEKFKEFQARDLDRAILDACEYYDVPREQLEIEIVQDAKSGIFGIVGSRKAKIRARRSRVQETVEQLLSVPGRHPETDMTRTPPVPRRKRNIQRKEEQPDPADEQQESCGAESPDARECRTVNAGKAHSVKNGVTVVQQTPLQETAPAADGQSGMALPECGADDPDAPDALSMAPVETLDALKLAAETADVVGRLVRPISGEDVQVDVDIDGPRVRAELHGIEDSGLLIGREGQTLAAIQYLASRMVSKIMGAGVRIQLDAGEYRQKQDEKVREMALSLAQKAMKTGKSYSTRPLSSYHRRLVHLCLQDRDDIQTRSIGDGTMKRVVIMCRKTEKAQ